MTQATESFSLPSWEDIPDLDLYLDQVLNIVTQAFRVFESETDSKVLTGSMINNYVKHQVMPAPVKKRYKRTHVVYLFMILFMKTTLPLETVREVIERAIARSAETLGTDESDEVIAYVYEGFRQSLNEAIEHVFDANDVGTLKVFSHDDNPVLSTFYWACTSLCARMNAARLAADL